MKKLIIALAASGCLTLGAFRAQALLEVGVGVQIHAAADFYTPLAASGAWVEVGSYGRCWRPAGVVVGWRPYCDGHWEWTDAGWYWVSDEPWAWACYHYGRWDFDPGFGWVWIPDVEWAPAWVYWRVGGEHVGWAPCPPRGRVVIDANFVFVDTHHFRDRVRPSTVIINDPGIIRGSKLITKVSRSTRTIEGVGREKIVINNGPSVERIQKATGSKFTAVPIHEAARLTRGPERHVEQATTPVHDARPAEPARNERGPEQAAPPRNKEPEHVAPQPAPPPDQGRHEEAPRDRGEGDRHEDRHDEGGHGDDHGHGRDKDHH